MKLLFLREGLKKIGTQGSLVPSSRYLSNRIAKKVPVRDACVVVELGAGTGVFTKAILKRLPMNGKLVAFEVNHTLADFMKKKIDDDRLIVIEDDASRLVAHLRRLSLPLADCVVSGLPLGEFPRKKRQELLSAIRDGLRDDGVYLQFQYAPLSLRHIREMFDAKIVGFELRNIPPAFLYECRKKGSK